MSSTPAAAPPPANKVATTTSVDTAIGTAGATATLPSWMAGTWIMVVGLSVLVWVVLYWVGAAKLSYDTSGSGLWALLAFIFAPFYYPYYAFFISKPAPAPAMMGGGRGGDPIGNLVKAVGATLKAGQQVAKTFKK
jgi:hypothetical protein